MATKMWKVVYGSPTPVEVEAAIPMHPYPDANGDTIFANTHFLTVGAAWKQHLAEHKAGFSLAASHVNDLRRQLADADKTLIEASLAFDAAQTAHEQYIRGGGR